MNKKPSLSLRKQVIDTREHLQSLPFTEFKDLLMKFLTENPSSEESRPLDMDLPTLPTSDQFHKTPTQMMVELMQSVPLHNIRLNKNYPPPKKRKKQSTSLSPSLIKPLNTGNYLAYGEQSKPKDTLSPPPFHFKEEDLPLENWIDWEIFARLGSPLPSPFTLKELKFHYYFLARKHHPDRGGCAENFKKIHSAYLALKYLFDSCSPRSISINEVGGT